ncbi:MAG: isochorismatase [Bacteroidota bacterium]
MALFPALPQPHHLDVDRQDSAQRVAYEARVHQARAWAKTHAIQPSATDAFRVGLLLIDMQNTFCTPGYELYVAGRSGVGAAEDVQRTAAFIYRHVGRITQVVATLDTHQAVQIFHSLFFVDAEGQHPPPYTTVSVGDLEAGRWRFNAPLAPSIGLHPDDAQAHVLHYARTLEARGKYALTIWPYHAMLGSHGHALAPAIEDALFFHGAARHTQADLRLKGRHPLTEHYSALGPEVAVDEQGGALATLDDDLIRHLLAFDALLIAGEAQSHCVAWTVEDLRLAIERHQPDFAQRVYLLDDATSPVVVPGADYTDQAEAAFVRFAQAGMHRVRTTTPWADWPGPVGAQARR